MRVIAAGRSDVGLQREHNEDSFCLLEQHGLFIVADGMGGHRAGDVASRMATEAITAFFNTTAREDATWPFHYDPTLSAEENRLITGIKVANKSIYEASARSREHQGMGTTVVGMLFSPSARRIYIGHVGDSRCYRIRNGEITQLTQDHSLLNDYLRAMPDLTQDQRDELPRNVITRALGMTESVQVDVSADEPRPGDVYVLCSDGLSGMISDDEILQIVQRAATPDDAARQLIALANEHGGEDNVTAVVAKVVDE
jgi:protein phosphatase